MRPLADILRPTTFDDFVGQEHLTAPDAPFRKLVETGHIGSVIFWGPPGVGKTTLAHIVAGRIKAHVELFSGAVNGIKEVRVAIQEAKKRLQQGEQTILFIDEIHRFNKAQQDAFLPYVEDGTIILIGATTENPSFYVIAPLLSRSHVFILYELNESALLDIVRRSETHLNRSIDKAVKQRLVAFADGDARQLLNALEFADKIKALTPKAIGPALEKIALRYDKKGEEHYNLISAFIKSMRDSNPHAALYWMARMLEAGEDPRFLARRMVIFASEDIGNANPWALMVATAVANAVEYVGLPEAQINLAHGVTFLATAPKSNASYAALLEALEDARKGSFGVPLHLRNAATKLMKGLGYGKGYQYAHDYDNAKVSQTHFPKEIGEKHYYKAKDIGYEGKIQKKWKEGSE